MAHLGKSALLSLGVLAGVAFAAQAQTTGIASLPPNATVAPPPAVSPVTPSVAMPGPNPGGSPNAGPSVRFEKSADWDANTANKPYTSNLGPRPH